VDRFDLFRIFVRVVECSSFTRASSALGIPRSSVSVAVSQLEDRIGTRLLNRTTRTVAPTHDGTAFYERCKQLIQDVEETEALFQHNSTMPTGKIRVDVPGRIGRLIIAPALPAFLKEYPNLDVELGVTDRAVDLVEDGLDCVLRVGPLRDSELIARSLGVLPLINVASPEYLAEHGTPSGPHDLLEHWAVNYTSPSTGRVEPWEWFEDGELRGISMKGRVTVSSAEGYIACGVAGLGLIQIPAYDVQPQLKAGELIEIMPDHRPEPMPMTLLYPHRQHLSLRVQIFADWIERVLKIAIGESRPAL